MATANPYIEARREWNDRYFDLTRAVRNWQIVAGGALLLDVILATGLVWLGERRSVVPYIIEVDKLGYAIAAGPARRDSDALSSERIVRYQLAAFIRGARSVIADPTAMKRNLDQVYAYTRGEAVTFLDEYYRHANPFERAKDGTVAVDVSSLLPLSAESWQIRWSETARALDGQVTGRTSWEGVVTLKTSPPTSEENMIMNPIGLYVVNLTWTRQL